MMRLLVNIDHIATLRNARGEGYPDPAEAAKVCENAGAQELFFICAATGGTSVMMMFKNLKSTLPEFSILKCQPQMK